MKESVCGFKKTFEWMMNAEQIERPGPDRHQVSSFFSPPEPTVFILSALETVCLDIVFVNKTTTKNKLLYSFIQDEFGYKKKGLKTVNGAIRIKISPSKSLERE